MIRIEPGPITRIVLDRAAKRNALTPAMLHAMLGTLRALPAACRVVTITGEGSVFCAGFDLKLCEEDDGALPALLSGLSAVIIACREIPQPVIVGVHGAALAGGCAVLGGADYVIASKGCTFGYPVLRIGVSPAVSAPFLMDQMASGAARELLLSAEPIPSERALELDLVHEIVPDDTSLTARVLGIANNVLTQPPAAVTNTKRWCNQIGNAERSAANGLSASLALAGSLEQRTYLSLARRKQQ